MAQLHRRAELLNEDYQQWIVSVVMGHAISQEIEAFGDEELVSELELSTSDVGDDGLGLPGTVMFPGGRQVQKFRWRTPSIWGRYLKLPQSPSISRPVVVTAELGNICHGSEPDCSPYPHSLPLARAPSAVSSMGGGESFTRAASASSMAGPEDFTRAASAGSVNGAGAFTRAASANSNGAGAFTRAASAASSSAGSALGRSVSLAMRQIASGVAGGLRRLKSMGFGRQSMTESVKARGGDDASIATPSLWLRSAVAAECAFITRGKSRVEVYPAPVKTLHRMREKVKEYFGESAAGGGKWPLCANILDPVRASVVCNGPAEILEIFNWFTGRTVASQKGVDRGQELEDGTASSNVGNVLMPVCRVKNKFALPKEELVGG